MKEATRQEIHGVQVLRYPDHSLYVEVAERVRLAHNVHASLQVERGEVLPITSAWVYRTTITLGGAQYIGDAEIHFDAPPETPDGTNPITCGQTSAIGNALAFAGFGDLPAILERLGEPVDDLLQEHVLDSPQRVIEGVRVVMLDETPYVPVAERVRQVHRAGKPFSIDAVEILEINGIWIYRATVSVDGKRVVGDAEIFFDAPKGSIDGKYPVSSGQTSAVGNALALAGFADVRSILERQGKRVEGLVCKPSLASADAVVRAQQYAHMQQERSASIVASVPQQAVEEDAPLSLTHMQRLRTLYERLGESEPVTLSQITTTDAEHELRRLQMLEDELFHSVDAALQEIMNRAEVGTLKRSWIKVFQIRGYVPEVQKHWQQFKLTVCQCTVNDEAMNRTQYDLLTSAIEQEKQQRTQASPSAHGPHTRAEQ